MQQKSPILGMHHIAQNSYTAARQEGDSVKEDANMAMHASGRGHVWLVLLAILGAALVSLLALAQWDSAARADEQEGRGHRITLERGAESTLGHEPSGAANRGDLEPKVVGGTPVADGTYPFMAFLDITYMNGSGGRCGGTLIARDSVLTAAHCVRHARRVFLTVGRTVISESRGQVRSVRYAFTHPRYNFKKSNAYDAAVLKLRSPVKGIKPIKLATAKQNGLEQPGHTLKAAGWGSRSEGGNLQFSDRMRVVSLPVVSDRTARRAYSSQPPVLRYFPSLMVAAGAKGKDACQGDSGGPLFNPGSTSTQVGIVSYGIGCAEAGFPGVYTEINNPSVRTFIVNAARR
jgi:secreted trypsin-like serine protease